MLYPFQYQNKEAWFFCSIDSDFDKAQSYHTFDWCQVEDREQEQGLRTASFQDLTCCWRLFDCLWWVSISLRCWYQLIRLTIDDKISWWLLRDLLVKLWFYFIPFGCCLNLTYYFDCLHQPVSYLTGQYISHLSLTKFVSTESMLNHHLHICWWAYHFYQKTLHKISFTQDNPSSVLISDVAEKYILWFRSIRCDWLESCVTVGGAHLWLYIHSNPVELMLLWIH